MKKALKIIGWSLLALVLLLGGALALFIYKVKNGFPVSYETEKPGISFPANKPAVLLFSKTTGFRHDESIVASKPVFQQMYTKPKKVAYLTRSNFGSSKPLFSTTRRAAS
jgi:uncharacterized protein